MATTQLFDLNGEQRFSGTQTGGGGAQPFESETGTTSPTTFDLAETFNVGAAGVVVLAITLTAVDADGETFGAAMGDIAVLITPQSSPDGITWSNASTLATAASLDANGNASTVSQFYTAVYATMLEGRGIASIVNSADGSPYAGANHPTATVRFDYGVLTLGSTLT